MRIVVTGATGNVGTSVVAALAADARVSEIVGLARRRPRWSAAAHALGAGRRPAAPLAELFRGADAVIHLAWLIQPSRDEATLEAANVDGSRRVFEAAAAAGAGALVHASSVGAYSPGPVRPRGRRVVADRRDADVVLRAPQGRGGAGARRGRGRASRPAGRAAAAGADLQARGRDRDPAAVRRAVAALAARAARPAAACSRCPPGCAIQAVHADDVARGVPARGDRRAGARRLQRRGRAGARRRGARPRARRTAGARCRCAVGARRRRSDLARCGSSRRRPAGSTWAWRCR